MYPRPRAASQRRTKGGWFLSVEKTTIEEVGKFGLCFDLLCSARTIDITCDSLSLTNSNFVLKPTNINVKNIFIDIFAFLFFSLFWGGGGEEERVGRFKIETERERKI